MKRIFNLFRRRSSDLELAREMKDHVDEKIEDLVASGLSLEEATSAAQRQFGNRTILLERSRDVWTFPVLESLGQDLRYALRSLRKSPMFTAVVVLPLALGIGANTAIFTVVDAALIRALPYKNPERLVHFWEFKHQPGAEKYDASYPDFVNWRDQSQLFEGVAGYQGYGIGITFSAGREPEQIAGAGATANFFPVLGTQASLGRTFLPGEDRRGSTRVVVVSDSLWRRRFGADPHVVGKTVRLNDQVYTVVGVLPAGFQFARVGEAEVWLPLIPSRDQEARSYWHWLDVIARLKPNVTPQQGQAELARIAERIAKSDPKYHAGAGIRMVPLRDEIVGQVRPLLLVLLGTISLVLLIACANVANLLLVRSAGRQKEIAVRGSLGASRGRLAQQLLTESLVLAVLGGACGLAMAYWGVHLLTSAIPDNLRAYMPYLRGLTLNWQMLGFTVGITLLTGIAFGLAPALRASHSHLQESLKSGRRTSEASSHLRLRRLLVVSEVAISVVLLAGAGLMMKSTLRLLRVNPGFDPNHLLTMRLSLPGAKYSKSVQRVSFHSELMSRLESLPGVRGAASVSVLPLSGGGDNGTFHVLDRPETRGAREPDANVRTISTGYFRAMGISLVKGRHFTDRDNPTAPKAVIVNQKLVHLVFGNQDPIGQRISFVWSPGPWEIVGVVADENVISLDAQIRPVVYFPYAQDPDNSMNLVIRSAGAIAGLTDSVSGEVRSLDPEVPVYAVKSMDRIIADAPSTFIRRYPAFLIGIFAGIALLLATVGTYGLVTYSVTQRTHEIGIRMALGAEPRDILMLIMGQGLVLVFAGVLVGLAGALALARSLSALLFGIEPSDPMTFLVVSLVLGVSALLASYVPARRATKADPTIALACD